MSARCSETICLTLGTILLVGCASAPPRAPAPLGTEAAAITMKVQLRLPRHSSGLGEDATTVYFVKACAGSGTLCEEQLIPSNHASNGRVYLLNAEPGEYRPVAASFETFHYGVVVTSSSVDITYLPDSLVREASVQVRAGRLSDAGHHRVQATYGICPNRADPGQVRYADLMEPGSQKCGLVQSAFHSLVHVRRVLRPQVIIGGKAYPMGTWALHYRGVSYETLPSALGTNAFEEALKELEASGWHVDAER